VLLLAFDFAKMRNAGMYVRDSFAGQGRRRGKDAGSLRLRQHIPIVLTGAMRRIAAMSLLMLLLILGHHAAAQTTEKIINLLCNGTSATNDIQEPANNVRLVVDLTDATVTGFGIITRIDRADDASISFSGKGPLYVRGMTVGTISLTGEFDRVSSGLTVIATTTLPSSEAAKATTIN
jgi:hypothetical protein